MHLPAYDGPLDLLLHLIRKDTLDIFDIPIARLTTSYLAALKAIKQLDIEPASDFLLMAATLLQLKSRMLLPRPASLDDVPEGVDDPRAKLVEQLLEYQRYKAVAEALGQRTRVGQDVFARPPGQGRPAPDADEPLASHDAWRLAEAFRRLVAQGQFESPHDIYVERVSIGERIAQIADHLAVSGATTFEALCGGVRYREELITSFLALLEMVRLKLIRTQQDARLGPVQVEPRVGAIGPLGDAAAGMLD